MVRSSSLCLKPDLPLSLLRAEYNFVTELAENDLLTPSQAQETKGTHERRTSGLS
jgi:hypothetical protein